MTASERKKILRKNLADRKALLTSKEVNQYSDKILSALSNFVNWNEISKLHAYLPIAQYNEVNTENLISYLKQNYADIVIEIAPKKADTEVSGESDYDLIILPVVGFDRRGFRLGYGGGYYDKFLAKNRCRQIIGLAYSFLEVEQIPEEPHDQKMQIIITEKEIIRAI